MEPETSWFLVRFVSAVPQWELLLFNFIVTTHGMEKFPSRGQNPDHSSDPSHSSDKAGFH